MANRIVYLSWPPQEIAGGIKTRFMHVELLRSSGVNAVIACENSESPGWFDTTAPIIDIARDIRPHADVLVFPENHLGMFKEFSQIPNKKVVYCQNQFMIFRGMPAKGGYEHFGVSHVLCTGTVAAEFCRRRCRSQRVDYVPHFINHGIFAPHREKKVQIASIPRKRTLEYECVRDLFQAENPQWADIPWISIVDRPASQVASIMAESALFLSLSRFESFGNIPLESMASGCVVAGFTGGGGREYATQQNGFWAEEDDCLQCADQLAAATRIVLEQGTEYQARVDAGLATASRYHRSRTAPLLANYWRQFLD